jgi:ribosome assembly protein 1
MTEYFLSLAGCGTFIESFKFIFVLCQKMSSLMMTPKWMIAMQVMTAVKEACRAAVLARNPRIAEALYFCEVGAPAEHLGQIYGVLGKRRARVVKEEMREGTAMFTVHAYMPVSESFGFADELRRKTSGAASPQLVLSHWEPLAEDPFFVPRTEEELEEFGDGLSAPRNTARKLIDAVRRRKGLPVEEKLVQHGAKQRTRARKV